MGFLLGAVDKLALVHDTDMGGEIPKEPGNPLSPGDAQLAAPGLGRLREGGGCLGLG